MLTPAVNVMAPERRSPITILTVEDVLCGVGAKGRAVSVHVVAS